MESRAPLDVSDFIRTHLPLAPLAFVPEIRLHLAHPGSGLRRLAERDKEMFESPYWAFPWAGGLALARYILDRPETVRGRRVLDLGAGSGVVAIAAAKAGASEVIAADVNRYAIAALQLNATANEVGVSAICDDLTAGAPPAVDLIAIGDLFYERDLAERVTAFADRCLAVGVDVLIGDPGRAFLPRTRLRLLAEYAVADFGERSGAASGRSSVFALEKIGDR